MKKAFRKMLAVLMALTMIVANFAIIAVNAEEGHSHAEEVKCPGVGEEHTKTNCDWTAGEPVAPTETKQGYTRYTCDVCKAPFLADFLPALGHTKHVYGDPQTVEPADCITDGYVYVECTVDGCDENIEGHIKKLKDIPAPGHEMVVDGKGCKCVNCDDMTQVKHTYVVKSFTAPTAEAQGKATLECDNCGDVQVDVPVSKICDETHVWVEKVPPATSTVLPATTASSRK